MRTIILLIALVASNAHAGEYSLDDFRSMLVSAHQIHLQSLGKDNRFARQWDEWLDSVVRKREYKIIEAVNFRFNRFGYQTDEYLWDAEDYWAPPEVLYEKGRGDCEDFAIAKYFALLELGFDREKLKIAIGTLQGESHAVLTYWDDGDYWILDNTRNWPQRASKRKDFEPLGYIQI